MRLGSVLCVLLLLSGPVLANEVVDTTEELVAAVRDGAEGTTIDVAAGAYELDAPLELKAGMTLKGAGIEQTIITHTPGWKPSVSTLPDPEVKTQGLDSRAYLIRLNDKASDVTISDLTLRGPQMHGAIYGFGNENLHVHHVRIENTLWSGIRTLSMRGAKIHDCEFVDAGGRWERGKPGTKGGITGGAIFAIWMKESEISHNHFSRTLPGEERNFYGVKVRQGKQSRIHHNTIHVNFSIELPFENDEDVEIDHNFCAGVISIPKHAGGPVPTSGRTFHIHHNWMTSSYAIEFVRNGVEIDHNLFDFSVESDGGNLISAFGRAPAAGPAKFHNNLVSNPGRGVMWMNEPYSNLEVYNNHIIARTTATPRKDGLFGFNEKSDFSTFRFENNIIECQGLARPMFRNEASYRSTVRNNSLINVSDAERLENTKTDAAIGLEQPLKFHCGVHDEFLVYGWKAGPAKE
jgi:nitrous oxidase accessory protein